MTSLNKTCCLPLMTPFVKGTKGTKPAAERKSKEGSYMEQGEEQVGDDVDLETGIPGS